MSELKKTLVLGATPNPERYSYMATSLLRSYKHEVVAFGLRQGTIGDVDITQILPEPESVHTITLYLGPQNQPPYIDAILKIKPKRVIFNPGTENPEFFKLLQLQGIEAIEACTLVMLRTGQY
jgi:predicted CoA-binding protein